MNSGDINGAKIRLLFYLFILSQRNSRVNANAKLYDVVMWEHWTRTNRCVCGWRRVERKGGGEGEDELERAKLRICKCSAHNNAALLYTDAVGCVAVGGRSIQCASNTPTVTKIFHFQTQLFARFRLAFKDNAKIIMKCLNVFSNFGIWLACVCGII